MINVFHQTKYINYTMNLKNNICLYFVFSYLFHLRKVLGTVTSTVIELKTSRQLD
jgi:hypothetical protein